MPWDDVTTTGGNAVFTYATTFVYQLTNTTTANTGWISSNATTVGGYGMLSAQPYFDPAQVAGLRDDYRAVKESRKRKKAELKARRLFRRTIGDVAYENFKRRGYHEIYGKSGARYRLIPGRWVKVMEGCADKVAHELCAHLPFGVPWFDNMAVQHLMLTSSKETEAQFLKIANKHSVGNYPIPEMAA